MEPPLRVLGIDPGLRLTGFGCIERPVAGGRAPNLAGVHLVDAGVLRLDAGCSISHRLGELDADFRELLARLKPDVVAVECLYAHYKHPATAIAMGHARGVLLLAIRQASLPLVELRPTEVKKSLTGYGQAQKPQMQDAIRVAFGLAEPPSPPDIADALAIALCAERRAEAEAMTSGLPAAAATPAIGAGHRP